MKKILWFAGALVALPATLNGGQGTSDFLRYQPSGQWATTTATLAPGTEICTADAAATSSGICIIDNATGIPTIMMPDDPVALLKYRWWQLALERNRYRDEYNQKLAAIETALKKLR